MNSAYRKIVVLFILSSLYGCAHAPYQPYAREVKKIPQSNGVIALHENHQDEDRAKADLLMRSNCGNKPVEVLEEGEVVTGTQTNSNAKKTNELENQGGFQFGAVRFGGSDENAEKTATQATQTNLKEWQIRYQCAIPEVSAKASATSKKAVHK